MANTTLDDVIAKLTEARERFGNINVYMTDDDGYFIGANIEVAKVVLNSQDDLVSLSDDEIERLSDEALDEPTLEGVQGWWNEMCEAERQYWQSPEAILKLNHDSWLKDQAVLARHLAAPFSAVIV